MDTLKKPVPDYVIMDYRIPESSLPVLLDNRYGYASGRDRRRERRADERKKKK